MFSYRFSCFSSLVTNVTKKSSKSFWDRKLCAISLHRWSRARGVLGPFFSAYIRILDTGFTRPHGGSTPHRASRRFPRPHRLHGIPRDSSTAQRSPCIAGAPRRSAQPGFSYKTDFSYSFSYNFSYKIFLEQLCFSIDSSVSSLL